MTKSNIPKKEGIGWTINEDIIHKMNVLDTLNHSGEVTLNEYEKIWMF